MTERVKINHPGYGQDDVNRAYKSDAFVFSGDLMDHMFAKTTGGRAKRVEYLKRLKRGEDIKG